MLLYIAVTREDMTITKTVTTVVITSSLKNRHQRLSCVF